MTPSDGSDTDRVVRLAEAERRVAYAKEHALRQIRHLARELDYDYPASEVSRHMTITRRAAADYRRVWNARAAIERERVRVA